MPWPGVPNKTQRDNRKKKKKKNKQLGTSIHVCFLTGYMWDQLRAFPLNVRHLLKTVSQNEFSLKQSLSGLL